MAYVLVVDDNEDMGFVTCLALERVGGHKTEWAESGAEAFTFLSEGLPDLILLDVMMPVMNGFEVFERLRSDPTTAAIPVVFITARVMPNERAELHALGPAGVLAKPYDVPELVTEVARVLGLKQPSNVLSFNRGR